MSKVLRPLSLALSLALVACQSQNLGQTGTPTPANHSLANTVALNPASRQPAPPAKSYPALTKTDATGSVSITGQTLTLTLQLPALPETTMPQNFTTQLLDLTSATKLFAQVTDSHGQTYTPNLADVNGAINYTAGTITLTFNDVVPDELLFVEVQAKNGTTDIPQANLATVLKHTTSASPVSTTLNFQTTVAAKAMKALLTADADRSRLINLSDLSTLTTAITGVTGTAPNLTYAQKHPSLVNTALLATDLQTQLPNALTAADYRQNVGATVNLTVSGLTVGDKVQLQITDAASAIQTDLGNGTTNITGLTPGSGLNAIVTPFGTPSQTYTYTLNPTSLSLTEGNTANLTVTATPTMTLTNISPANGAAGTAVTITGTGFTGATDVSFNGSPAASFTVNSDTQITATVPVTATDGTISVTKGGTTKYSTDFDVYRRIYVNDDANGNNNGTSWANAYTSLQTALGAAGANDEVWVAAGTYKPTTDSNRAALFSIKDQVNLYGGFNGTETLLSQRNISANPTILSGDLNGDDNYTTTPPGNISDNSQQIMQANSLTQQTTDGFVIQGGNSDSNGAGLEISGSQITLENLTFKHNTASDRAGALMLRFTNNITLKNSAFLNNTATQGAVLAGSDPINIAEMRNIVFKGNKDTTDSGGLLEVQSINIDSVWENLIFIDNNSQGRAIYANIYNPDNSNVTFTLKNILVANNTLQDKTINVYGDSTGTFIGHNITLANNSCPDQGSGFCDSDSTLTNTTMNNWLYWRDSVNLSGAGSNNINLGSGGTPFIDSTDPDGPDNIFFTADDGYNLAAGNAGIDAGNTNAGVPDKDIANQDRVGNTDAGAYEYQAPPLPANVILVDRDASGANNGTSWANAYTSLQSALTAATAGKEIWMAEGTYTPTAANGDRNTAFVMKSNVDIYGGFAGGETTRTARDPFAHVVKLSGDLNGNDNYASDPFTGISENSYTVVLGANNAILDGVTIEGGNSDAAFDSGAPADPADRVGGGMRNNAQSPTLNEVIFTHNTAVSRAGAMFNTSLAAPVMTRVVFIQNVSGQGGAIFNLDGSPKINIGAFIDNKGNSGGGMYTRTAIGTVGNANPVLRNVIFSGNSANQGGGMYSSNYATPELINVTFSNNTGTTDAGAFYDVTSSTTTSIKNVLFWNSTRRSSPVIPLIPGDGNIDAASDPFVNAANVAGPDGRYFTTDDGLRISASASAVLNAGTNTGLPVGDTDIIGNSRPGSGNANAEPGAYEYTP
jgi:hypothetical protein